MIEYLEDRDSEVGSDESKGGAAVEEFEEDSSENEATVERRLLQLNPVLPLQHFLVSHIPFYTLDSTHSLFTMFTLMFM